MTDRPILFSAPMIRAILDGRKTQTRRVFKPRGFEFYTHPISGDRYDEYRPYRNGSWDSSRMIGSGPMQSFGWGDGLYAYAPYAPSDRLWVRETWTARMTHGWTIADARRRMFDEEILYRADATDSIDGWWSPIHMPREFSRITLMVTDVRVQRLQDISAEDVAAEGVEWGVRGGAGDYRHQFMTLWDSLNAARAPWASNPWVVAVTFRPILQNIDQIGEVD